MSAYINQTLSVRKRPDNLLVSKSHFLLPLGEVSPNVPGHDLSLDRSFGNHDHPMGILDFYLVCDYTPEDNVVLLTVRRVMPDISHAKLEQHDITKSCRVRDVG